MGLVRTLPDILEAAGCVGYVFHRPTPLQVDLPANVFRWRGPGGGEVMGMRLVPAYVTFGADLSEQILGAAQAVTPGLEHVMCFYGVGNHGGGPTKAHIEYIRDHLHAFPGIELRFSTPDLFYAAVRPSWDVLPVVAADLELQHTFPGCYSVMHEIKQRQSATEHLLAQSERVIETFVSHPDEKRALRSKLDAAWEDLLFTQFHDILAGACIGPAYTAVRALQGRALISGEEIVYDATRRWARQVLPPINEQQMVVLNADDEPWEGLVEAEPSLDFDAWGQRWLSDLRGQPVPFQRVQAAGHLMTHRILFPLRVEVRDAQQLLLRTDAPPSFSPLETDLDVSPDYLANGRMRVEVDQHGICQIWLDERPLLSANGISLHLRADGTDTWVMESDAFTRPVESLFSSQAEQWTLLRSPRAASVAEGWASDVFLQTGRDSYTDQGEHHFQFQFLASRAVLSDALLEKRAQQQVQPPIVFDRYEGLYRPPWSATPPQHLQKPLETNTTQLSQ